MPNFKDDFNRAGPLFGNLWKRKPKDEAWVGQDLPSFILQNNRMEAPPAPRWFYFRDHPVPLDGVYEVIWTCSKDKVALEGLIRYTATGGRNNERLVVRISGSQGHFAYRKGPAGITTVNASETVYGEPWARIDGVDFEVRVTVVGDSIKVYDTGRATGNTADPVFEIDTPVMKDATGIGVGNGFVDTFEIKDFSTSPTAPALRFSEGDLEINANLMLTVGGSVTVNMPDAKQNFAGLVLPDYMAMDGIPQRLPTHLSYSNVDGMLGNETVDTKGLALDPLAEDTGMLYRFIPRSDDFGAGLWTPFKGAGSSGNFNMQLHRFNGASQTGGELQRYLNFTYRSTYGSLVRRVINLQGKGVLQLIGENFSFVGMTMAMVFIPKPGPFKYGIFSEDRSHPHLQTWSQDIDIRRSGRGIEWVQKRTFGSRHARYGYTSRPNRPVILIFSHEASTGRSSLFIQEQSKYYRVFRYRSKPIPSDDPGTYWNGWIGSTMSTLSEFSEDTAMRGQILEIDLDFRFLDRGEVLELASVLSAMYGVGA